MNRKDEIEVESIDTPKGKVPTVKGLETALNHVLDQTSPIVTVINNFANDISVIKQEITNMSAVIQSFGNSFAELIILLGKLNKEVEFTLQELKSGKMEGIKQQQDLLIELKTILTKTLLQFQELPLELKINPD